MPKSQSDSTEFQGFQSPNYTQVPDELIDHLMIDLSGAELKVVLYIIRRTFGFKRDSDNISLSQMLNGLQAKDGRVLDRGVGLSKKTLLQALRSLEEKRIILTQRRQSLEKGNEPTAYRLNMATAGNGAKSTPPLGEKVPQGVGEEIPPSPRGKNSAIQQTVKQQTDINHSNLRKASPENEKTDTELTSEQGSGQPVVPPIVGGEDLQLSSAVRGLAAIGDVLATKRRRSQRYDEDRQVIVDLLSDFRREFNDQATLKQSVSRAYNLLQRSDLDIGTFTSRMYEARAITKERSASITSVLAGSTSLSAKHKMAYWFSILEDLCGLKPNDSAQSSPSGQQS
jgi:phage replication O-like protein O